MTRMFRCLPLACLLLAFVLTINRLSAQTAPPTVPDRLDFAGMLIRFDPGARQLIQQDINALLSNQRYWQAKLDRVLLCFPSMEATLIDEGVPVDFKYLAVQESSLSPDAVSSSSAVGYWQFKAQTAQDQGLRVDDEIDERKNLSSSTRGAARYLKRSNLQFNNWVSSLYSFYLGAGGMSKIVPADWFYARELSLDQNTDRYVLRFFAHKIAIENALVSYRPATLTTLLDYADGSNKTLGQIAREVGIDEADLLRHNRWLLTDAPIPTDKPYVVAVPVPAARINEIRPRLARVGTGASTDMGQVDVGFPVLKKITLGMSAKHDPVLYEINGLPGIQAQPSDDVASLACRAKISVSSLLKFNDMNASDEVVPMEVYYLAKKHKKALVPFHTVRDGETTRSVSQRYGIRLRKLMRYNRMDRAQKLTLGRVMWLRDRRPADKPIEIITAPKPPIYDPNAATRTPVAGNTGSIPRNPSERVLYQPKLADAPGGPPRPTTYPVTTPPASGPAPVGIPPVSRPADPGSTRRPPVSTPTNPAPTTRPGSAPGDYSVPPALPRPTAPAGSDRVVIVRPADPTAPGSTTPAAKPAPTPVTPVVVAPIKPAPASTEPPIVAVVTPDAPTKPAVDKPVTVTPSATKLPAPGLPKPASVGGRTINHTVLPGQTYFRIAKLYGVSVEGLLAANSLTEADPLSTGQTLIVRNVPAGFPQIPDAQPVATTPTPASKPVVTPTPAPTPAGLTVYHVVAPGENMYRIGLRYGVKPAQIQAWNQLPDVTVQVGQRLRIVKQ